MTSGIRVRVEGLLEVVLRLGEGDFTARAPISDAQDEIDGVAIGLNMLAEELAAERAARRSAEDLLRDEVDAYEHAPGLFCSLDASLNVVKCNTTLAAALEMPKEEILGRSVLDLHTADARPHARAAFETILRGERSERTDFELLRRGGAAPVSVMLSASRVVDEFAALQRIRVVWRDVTSQKSLEQQLVQAQKLQGIGRLAGGIAHDFNNILTIVLATTGVALESVPAGSSLAEDLVQIQHAARAGADLTRGLLAFSRRSVVNPKVTTLAAVVETARKFLARLIGEHIRIEVRQSPDPWQVFADPSQFEQIVVNLAINARDAMPAGGTLTIETANVVLDEQHAATHLQLRSGEHAMLCVSDTGTGMTREVRERAFEPFFTTKAAGHGTGLGLSVCLGLVQQAGGTIWLYSEPGRGTTVKIYVPRHRGEQGNVLAPAEPTSVPGGSETILLAEDDVRVRSLTARILRGVGYRVLEATNGRHALNVASAHDGPIDLVITDVTMPELGGRQLVDMLRQAGRTPHVLFVSGYTENSFANDGLLATGVEFLAKPFGPATLLERVRTVLTGSG